MKSVKLLAAVMGLLTLAAVGVRAEDATTTSTGTATSTLSSLKYTSGKLSLGLVSGEVLQGFDIFKHVDDITTRTGASLTVAQYSVFHAWGGALVSTSGSTHVAGAGGIGLTMDSTLAGAVNDFIDVLPWSVSDSTKTTITSALTAKVYYGYDFSAKGSIIGVALGIRKVF